MRESLQLRLNFDDHMQGELLTHDGTLHSTHDMQLGRPGITHTRRQRNLGCAPWQSIDPPKCQLPQNSSVYFEFLFSIEGRLPKEDTAGCSGWLQKSCTRCACAIITNGYEGALGYYSIALFHFHRLPRRAGTSAVADGHLVPRRFWDNDEHLTGRGDSEVTTPMS